MQHWALAGPGPGLALLVDHDDAVRELTYTSESATLAEAESIKTVAARRGWTVASMAQMEFGARRFVVIAVGECILLYQSGAAGRYHHVMPCQEVVQLAPHEACEASCTTRRIIGQTPALTTETRKLKRRPQRRAETGVSPSQQRGGGGI